MQSIVDMLEMSNFVLQFMDSASKWETYNVDIETMHTVHMMNVLDLSLGHLMSTEISNR